MLENDLKNPQKYNRNDKYLLFPDSTLDKINYTDCNDTINGICNKDKSLDECIDMCSESKICNAGYYVKNDFNSYCVPLKTNDNLNLSHRLKNKKYYPELKYSDSIVFIDTSKYNFPPNEANTIFSYDIMQIKCNDNIMGLDNTDPPETKFHKGVTGTNIQLLSYEILDNNIIRYLPIQYNERIFINIVESSYILTKNNITNTFEWNIKLINKESSYITFKIIPLDKDYTYKSRVNFRYKFYLKYNDIENCYVDPNGNFKADTRSIEQLESEGNDLIFEFIPKMIGYYCNNGICEEIELEKTQEEKEKCTYKGNEVFRTKNCYNLCKTKNNITIKVILLLVIIIVVILIIIFGFYLYKYLNHHRSFSFYEYQQI